MKKITFANLKWMLLLLCLPLLASCDWEDLPAHDGAEISGAQFYYRWASDETDPITGEPLVKEIRLITTSQVNSNAGELNATVTVPGASGSFTETIREQVSTDKLWGQVTVSTAARITPIDGSAALGTPDNWSEARRFRVKAANGSVKEWTIRIVEFKK